MNKTYHAILVPFDGSKYSKRALQFATQLAKLHNAQMYIVNVVNVSQVKPPGKLFSSSEQKSLEQIRAAVKESAKTTLSENQKTCESLGISTKDIVLEGSISERLLQFIRENDIDLVVIGNRGLSGFSKIMTLGSVSRNISEQADCPVIIVH